MIKKNYDGIVFLAPERRIVEETFRYKTLMCVCNIRRQNVVVAKTMNLARLDNRRYEVSKIINVKRQTQGPMTRCIYKVQRNQNDVCTYQ